MSQDYDAFLAEVLATVPAEQKQGVEEALRNESVAKSLSASTLRQSDYSRQMDELAKAKEAAGAEINRREGMLEAEKTRYAEWYEGANKDYLNATEKLKRYRSEYGDLDGDTIMNKPTEDYLTKEQYEERLAQELEQRDRRAIKFADVLTDLKLEHKDKFSERLDTDALFEHIEKNNLNLEVGYKDFISDRVAEVNQAKVDEQIKQAREEGRMEGRSQAALPVQPDTSVAHEIMNADKPATSEERWQSAADAWRKDQASR
jgi:hypothetical protein